MLADNKARYKSLSKHDFLLECVKNVCCDFTDSSCLRLIAFVCLSVLRCCVTLNFFSQFTLISQHLQKRMDESCENVSEPNSCTFSFLTVGLVIIYLLAWYKKYVLMKNAS